jgi:uncharacterized membrane protein
VPRRSAARFGLAIALGGAAFALAFANSGRSFGYDEANTIASFVRPGGLLRPFTAQRVFNNHPLFSFLLVLQSHLTPTSERWMRLLPALCAAATVALFAWWAARRWGTASALGGAAVLATAPLFVFEVRQARGYALLVLASLVASVLLVDDVRGRGGDVGYPLAIAVAVGTHLYALLVVISHAAFLLARRPVDRVRLAQLAGGTALGGLVYAWMLRGMIHNARARGRVYRADLPSHLFRETLGGRTIAIELVSVLLAVAAFHLVRRVDLVAALLAPLAVGVFLWRVQQPYDLYARFFVVAVLPVAAAVAWGIGRHPTLLPIALVAAAIAVVPELHPPPHFQPVRELASFVTDARRMGLRPCAGNSGPLAAYTAAPPLFRSLDDTNRCDVVVQLGGDAHTLIDVAARRYPYRWSSGGNVVLSRVPRATLEAAVSRRGS